jgi:hypothetical protein
LLFSPNQRPTNIIPSTIPKSPPPENHNDCFIEAHDKILEEQMIANRSIIQRGEERKYIVNQFKQMIKIETVYENNQTKNYKNNEEQQVISSVLLPVTRENKNCSLKNKIEEEIKEKGSVLELRRIVHKTEFTNKIQTTPTAASEISEKLKIGETKNPQNIDNRLLTDNKNRTTAKALLNIIRDYNSYSEAPINEAGAYVINSIECRYKTKRAYQNQIRLKKKTPKFSISANDLTPGYTPADCLATTDRPKHSINTVKIQHKIQSNTKRKTVRMKFQVKKLSKNDNGGILNTVIPVQTGILTKRIPAQGDTGANCSATDMKEIIHNYEEFPFPQDVGVFSDDETGSTLQALGEGVIKIISDQGSIMEWTVLYTPLSSGTVLSPDNYHKTNQSKYYAFYHLGTNNGGKIGFLDHNQREIESIQMERTDNGEWLTTNQVLMATGLENKHVIRAVNRRSDRIRDLKLEQNDIEQAREDRVIIDQQMDESWATDLGKHHFDQICEEADPIFSNVNFKTTDSKQQQYSQKMKELELWHQRMGHCSTRTLNETRKCVEGIPDLPTNTPFFKCPFCERGKMVKKGGNKTTDKDCFIPGQAYHMDLAFVSGPSNLDQQAGSNITPSPIVKKSRDGYIGFLTIIDVSSRKLWTHPIKNKDPPIEYIDKFLKRHGIRNTTPSKAIITTSETGYLAKSRAFEEVARVQQYEIKPTNDDIDFFGDLLPDHVEATITTDGGGELSKSHDMKKVCNSHGYEVQSTAADSSSQNGIVERPHRTLKERMRCMLYSSRLGTEFWTEALLHATWLYNRTYHSKIKMTPLQAYSGQIPALDSLITFGAKITAKKPGTRPTTLNPWAYDGIFLGYQNTMHNIKYWDVNTGAIKTAKHDSKDEIQFGDDPSNRSPASKHLMEVFTGSNDHTTYTEPEHVEIEMIDKIRASPKDILEKNLLDSPLPYTVTTAAAAKVNRKERRWMEKRIRKMKAAFRRPEIGDLKHELSTLDISTNKYVHTTSHTIPLNEKAYHPTLGMVTATHPDMKQAMELVEFQVGTSTHRHIRSWKRRLRGTIITTINNEPIKNEKDIMDVIQRARNNKQTTIKIEFGSLVGFAMSGEGVPTLQSDQLNVIAHHLNGINNEEDIWVNKKEWPQPIDSMEVINEKVRINIMKRNRLKLTPEWDDFLKSEWKQLDRYAKVGMFGDPVMADQWMTILPWVWAYVNKEDPLTGDTIRKSRGTCNGGPRYGAAITLAETYAACVEQPVHRLTWAISAAMNLICKGYDVGNAFAEAPAPTSPFFMKPDAQFRQWWEEHLGRDPIPDGYVIPVKKALQGHPESPRLWDKYISKMITEELGFTSTVHEPCLYYKRDDDDNLTLILRQVDDFLVANKDSKECDRIGALIQEKMTNPLNQLGTIRKFNGVNVEQTRYYNHVHCETYIEKIVSHHGWEKLKTRSPPTPMKSDSKFQADIQMSRGPESIKEQKELERRMGFSYRQTIGELIYALTVCRVDISIAVITLSQHSHHPAQIHYEAVKQVFAYLNATKRDGLTYWRPTPRMDLPIAPDPTPISAPAQLHKFDEQWNALEITGSCDTTWASDRIERRSMGGIVMMLAGAAVYYRTRLQPTIAQSSTEAEFTNMADAGKAALYLRWILEEMGIIMEQPTPILADNQGAVRLANAHQPTRRTRHVEMKHFIILQWTDDKFIDFVDTSTDENYSDSLSKPTGRTKFYEHTDVFMGRRKPAYTTYIDQSPEHSQSKGHIINYVSVSTYSSKQECNSKDSNPLISLLQSTSIHSFDGLDSVSVGKCRSRTRVTRE